MAGGYRYQLETVGGRLGRNREGLSGTKGGGGVEPPTATEHYCLRNQLHILSAKISQLGYVENHHDVGLLVLGLMLCLRPYAYDPGRHNDMASGGPGAEQSDDLAQGDRSQRPTTEL